MHPALCRDSAPVEDPGGNGLQLLRCRLDSPLVQAEAGGPGVSLLLCFWLLLFPLVQFTSHQRVPFDIRSSRCFPERDACRERKMQG